MDSNEAGSLYDLARKSVEALAPPDRLRLIAEFAGAQSGEITPQSRRSLRELQGLGKEVWRNVDVDEYLRQERATWGG